MIPAKTWNQRKLRFSHSRTDELISASPVRRVAVGTQQHRNMEMRFTGSNAKNNLDGWIQAIHTAPGEISASVKRQAIHAFFERRVVRHQLHTPSILISFSGTKGRP